MSQLPKPYQKFSMEHTAVYRAYEALGAAAAQTGPLDAKSRELIKLGMAAASRSESGVQSHVYRALEAGATPAEVQHALIIGINTLGFSTMMAALTWANEAMASRSR